MTAALSVVFRSRAQDSTPATCRYRITAGLSTSKRTRVLRPIRTRSPSLGTRLASQVSGADHEPLFTERRLNPALAAFSCARTELPDAKTATATAIIAP